jgi:oxygen-dependent protoporphyrinogen oxidase
MPRIAILGGGISGLTAAYELEKARQQNPVIDWHLYEASDRLGGIIQTTRQDGYILEGGPDGWVTEKPWARDLAIELGLESQIIYSNDATRKTYILLNNKLQPIPDGMRMMVPTDLAALENSPLFSAEAKAAYAAEPTRAAELQSQAPTHDESVADFVRRHFGEEVLTKIAAPLLSGVFGGDVHKLSVRSVMPAFVTMEREHGSLITALQSKSKTQKPQPIFTALRNGLATLTESLIAKLPTDRIHLNRPALSLKRERNQWCLRTSNLNQNGSLGKSKKHFTHILLATPLEPTRTLLTPLTPEAAALLPTEASSAILAAFTWPETFPLPPGFGFLVPQALSSGPWALGPEPSLLAVTFVDQKFPHRAPANARILRAFFGGEAAAQLSSEPDATITEAALQQLSTILQPLTAPTHAEIRRWPHSLPQYEVGHLEKMAQLDTLIANLPNLTLLGNSYRGVGLPDLIRAARAAATSLTHP